MYICTCTHECMYSHIYTYTFTHLTRHLKHMRASWHKHAWVILLICLSHATHIRERFFTGTTQDMMAVGEEASVELFWVVCNEGSVKATSVVFTAVWRLRRWRLVCYKAYTIQSIQIGLFCKKGPDNWSRQCGGYWWVCNYILQFNATPLDKAKGRNWTTQKGIFKNKQAVIKVLREFGAPG